MDLFTYLKAENKFAWDKYTHHKIANLICDQKLDWNKFSNYLKQDGLFLQQFSNILKLLASKASSKEEKEFCQNQIAQLVNNELKNQETIQKFNIKEKDERSIINFAYTGYLFETTIKGDYLEVLAALCVCVLGYAEFANNYLKLLPTNENINSENSEKMILWLKYFQETEYQAQAKKWLLHLNSFNLTTISDLKKANLNNIWATIIELEIAFFDQAV